MFTKRCEAIEQQLLEDYSSSLPSTNVKLLISLYKMVNLDKLQRQYLTLTRSLNLLVRNHDHVTLYLALGMMVRHYHQSDLLVQW